MRDRRLSRLVAASIVLVLLAAACSDDKQGASSASSSGGKTPSTAPAATSNAWALRYTGGTKGAADSSLDPIVIGYVNQEGGVPAFPEATAGTEAAVKYINAELGGVAGHPVELKKCLVQAEEDGQR